MAFRKHRVRGAAVGALLLGLCGIGSVALADNPVQVELKAPMLMCHELSGGVQPPSKEQKEPTHDLIFFVISGRAADGSEIRTVAPKDGSHLKIDNSRKGMILKNVSLWKGDMKDGETVTLVLSVREQDADDTSESDINEAAEVAKQVDNAKSLAELSRIPTHEILHGKHGENDHIGTILVRIKNEKGRVVFDTESGSHAHYLKGHASNHPSRRAFQLDGDHSHYDLHLTVEE